jgi:biofilm protein TabA
MIVDRVENAHFYLALHKRFQKAFTVLADPGLAQKPDGRHDIDGDNLYFIVQHYTTKPVDQGRFEPYSEEKDIMFYRAGTMIAQTRLTPGLFCLLYPHDAHLPSCQVACPAEVHKVVFKVRLGT